MILLGRILLDLLKTFKTLLEDTFHDFFFHAARPCITHNIGGTAKELEFIT